MPNLAALLKVEITRLARKEVRSHTEALKRASTAHRREIADLKKQIKALQGSLRRAHRAGSRVRPQEADGRANAVRYSAKGLISHRQRLGLSRAQLGQLVGASAQAVYLWEAKGVRPRAAYLSALADLRKLGKREVAARLAGTSDPQE